jgi:hypothetical protein
METMKHVDGEVEIYNGRLGGQHECQGHKHYSSKGYEVN